MTYTKCNICEMLHFGYVILLGTVSDSELDFQFRVKAHVIICAYINLFKSAVIECLMRACEFYRSFRFKRSVRFNTEIALFYGHNWELNMLKGTNG